MGKIRGSVHRSSSKMGSLRGKMGPKPPSAPRRLPGIRLPRTPTFPGTMRRSRGCLGCGLPVLALIAAVLAAAAML
ncbi:MAG: hypothetical protein ACYC5O_07130 [Anaerolineae bacterium]